MKAVLLLVSKQIKALTAVLLSIIVLAGCEDWFKDPEPKFPLCAGTTHSFDPYEVATFENYLVTLSGTDVLYVEFFFTNYTPGTLFSFPSFHLWVKCVVNQTTTNYYDGYCTKSYDTGKWIGSSGLLYNGEYANCDFEFDDFTCTDVSGTCYIYIIEPQDTVTYSFEGTK